MDIESDIMTNWIYSYLKYGGVVTQEQRESSKKKFKQYLIDNDEALKKVYQSEKEAEKAR